MKIWHCLLDLFGPDVAQHAIALCPQYSHKYSISFDIRTSKSTATAQRVSAASVHHTTQISFRQPAQVYACSFVVHTDACSIHQMKIPNIAISSSFP